MKDNREESRVLAAKIDKRIKAAPDFGVASYLTKEEWPILRDVILSAAEPASGAIELIAAERQRQINSEGWTLEHDDSHNCGELANAAACYAVTSRLSATEPEGDDACIKAILATAAWLAAAKALEGK